MTKKAPSPTKAELSAVPVTNKPHGTDTQNLPMLQLVECRNEPRVDSRALAERLGLQHHTVFEMVKDYRTDFEQLGLLRFQTEAVKVQGSRGTKHVKSALLNEDQAYLLLSFSRNTAKVRALKVRLVRAFKDARTARQLNEADYLPGYHDMHDHIKRLAQGSANERFVHMNVNRLINKAVGIGPGQRQRADAPVKSMVIVAQQVARMAMESANDHHQGYDRAKTALEALKTDGCIAARSACHWHTHQLPLSRLA